MVCGKHAPLEVLLGVHEMSCIGQKRDHSSTDIGVPGQFPQKPGGELSSEAWTRLEKVKNKGRTSQKGEMQQPGQRQAGRGPFGGQWICLAGTAQVVMGARGRHIWKAVMG